ncbi:MAG TPA: DUF3604 domain-containing protein [Myxococcota bacterium]|nr:DUF3604 domain-containing protein [Myxococcota bacterium]HRY92958.1 DUF3604 domain-containing protein [Myxococcota bacterium]HSA22559.1 DUF3604 domain-containing protein [Myxococcota bacterium]
MHTRSLPPWLLLACALLPGCPGESAAPLVTYTQAREPCADRNPERNVYFGDLHAHTGLSFDAWAYGTHHAPADAYRFARGEALELAAEGGSVEVRLDRPLDFAAVTDHHEFLGEVGLCTTAGSPTHGCETCTDYRQGDMGNVVLFGTQLAISDPARFEDVCAPAPQGCLDWATGVWAEIVAAAEAADDKSAACSFSAFPAYEYTNAISITNLHRNVIYRNANVPALPPSFFEASTVWELWRQLDRTCLEAGTGCELISIPHNSNWSNGQLYTPDYEDARTSRAQAALAATRARLEPVAEIFQHKGDMECESNLSGLGGEADPLCEYEKQRHAPFEDCGDTVGAGGVSLMGCVSRLDFLRNVFKLGLQERARLGVNPYRFGVIGSTDTHNATPGDVDEPVFHGHVGSTDDLPEDRLGRGNMTHHGVLYNPGGLAAIWAVENSRDALFEALRRREVYGTSGTRIRVRAFAGFGLPEGWCARGDRVARGYAGGVPMGGELGPDAAGRPLRLVVEAEADPGAPGTPGLPLERLQLVKGWLDGAGAWHERVLDLAVSDQPASVDLETCETSAGGAPSLCAEHVDPEFDPVLPAFYYARVLEVPTCRWSVRQCHALAQAGADLPESCSDPRFYRAVQERAWTSPIWYAP